MTMLHRRLQMAREDGCPWFLTDQCCYYDEYRDPMPEEVTAEALADMMDRNAEGCNAHDFVCSHRGLAQVLGQEVGREAATRILRRLADYEGLYGMVGVCGAGDVANTERELGCSLHSWHQWHLAVQREAVEINKASGSRNYSLAEP